MANASAARLLAPTPQEHSAPGKRVGLVVRVSTTRQADNDEGSLKNQLQRLRAHVNYKSLTSDEPWSEVVCYELRAVSGKESLRSPEMERLVRDIQQGRVNTVCCTALDRVSRSVRDFLTFFEFLTEHRVEFVCLKQNYDTTSPEGRLFVIIMSGFAQFEREMAAERTRDAVGARAERGLWNGGRLFGYDLDLARKGYLVVNELEAEIVRFAFATYLACGSVAGCVTALNAAGYRTKAYTSRSGVEHAGKPFYVTLVQTLLTNPAYIGLKEIGKTDRLRTGGVRAEQRLVQAVWPAIIDQETFDATQALMRANGQTRTNQAREIRHAYVLNSGLLCCGACETPMEGRSGTGRLGARYYYYACPNRDCGLRVVAPEIEGAILARLGVLASDPDLLDALVAATNTRLQRQLPALGKRRRAITRDLAAAKGQFTKLLANLTAVEGAQAKALLSRELDGQAERQEKIEASLRDIDQTISQLQATRIDHSQARTALAQISQVYACLQPIEQKELFRLLVHRATVHPQRIVLELHAAALSADAAIPDQRLVPAHNALGDPFGSATRIRTWNLPVNSRPLYR